MITNEMKKERALELFCSLMEKKIFLVNNITPKTIAKLCNCKLLFLDRVLVEQLGFSIKQIITLYRIQYARELLSVGLGCEFACKYSGFNSRNSRKELEKALESIDN